MKRTAFALGCLLAWAGSAGSLSAADLLRIPVTRLADEGEGSLRAALETLNAAGGGEVDLSALSGEILLGSALPQVEVNVRLIGPPADVGSLLVNGGGRVPLLQFAAGTTSEVSRLVLTNALASGYRHGAAIWNAGTLLVRECALVGNRNQHGWGGAVYNEGDLTLETCVVRGNQAVGERGGDGSFAGALDAGGGGAGLGGALFHEKGALVARSVVFEANRVEGGAGGDFHTSLSGDGRGGGPEGGAGATDVLPAGDGGFGSGGGGGGVYLVWTGGQGGFGGGHSWNPVDSAAESAFGGGGVWGSNQRGGGAGAGMGGALFARSGTVQLMECQFRGNTARGGKGGAGSGGVASGGAGEGGMGAGAAVFVYRAELHADGCEWIGNSAMGGTGNSAGDFSSQGGQGAGGGVYLFAGTAEVTRSLWISNVAEGGKGGDGKNGGVGGLGRGAGVFARSASLVLDRSLLATNQALGGESGGGFRFQGAPGHGMGGAVFVEDGRVEVENVTLHGNRAMGRDGYDANLGFPGSAPGRSFGAGLTVAAPDPLERNPAFIGREDFRDMVGLARRIKSPSRPIDEFLRAVVADRADTRPFTVWNGEAPVSAQVHHGTLDALATVIGGYAPERLMPVWNAERFAGIPLREVTQTLLLAKPTGAELTRLHRLLMEDAYAAELIPMRGPLPTAPQAALSYCTVTGNEALQSKLVQFMFPAVTNGPVNGGGICNLGGSLSLEAVICFGNRAATNADLAGTFSSRLGNLFGALGTAVGAQPHDLIGVDPRLGPLRDHGGPTWTMELLPGSPARDRLALLEGVRRDQRGFARPMNGAWDLGAVEMATEGAEGPRFVRPTTTAEGEFMVQIEGLREVSGICRLEFSLDLETWERVKEVAEGEVIRRAVQGGGGYFRVVCSP